MLENIRSRWRSPGMLLGALALVAATSGVAVAAIPGGDGTATACISNDGTVKVIDAEAGNTCQGTQTQVKLSTTDATGKVTNADKLDGRDSTAFLGATAKAADADKLDGTIDSTVVGKSGRGSGALLDYMKSFSASVSCPSEGLALRGGVDYDSANMSVSTDYERDTYTVTWTARPGGGALYSYRLRLRCITGATP